MMNQEMNNKFAENHRKLRANMTYKVISTIFIVLSAFVWTFNLYAGAGFTVLGVLALAYFNNRENEIQKENSVIFNSIEHSYVQTAVDNDKSFSSKSHTSTEFGVFYEPEDSKEVIILTDAVKQSINTGIGKIMHKDFLYEKWNLKSIDKMENKNIFNFYGLPGTGKTLSAREVARKLNKPLFIVDYAQTESKLVGEAEKNISKIFKLAKEKNAIILLDEADTLVSKRVEDNTSSSRHINAARNVFMQEMDKFDGIVILTTNLFSSFDPAILRRVSQHIKFDLPNQEMRKDIIKAHIPEEVSKDSDVNFEEIAKMSHGFSGGDIKNMTREALISAIIEADISGDINQACLKRNHLISQIEKINKAKNVYDKTEEIKVIGIKS